MRAPLEVGATWLPTDTGPHLWADLRPVRAAADLAAMRAVGITTVRVHLAWDAFVPSHRQVSRPRLRDLDTVLEAARALGMRVVPVLFAQSFGRGLLLPRYAIDPRRPRAGVQVVTDGVAEPGGPRDQWADPLMIEVEVMWLETLLDSFANHPVVAAWDLGHDPASTLRPRRIAHTVAWVELLGGILRARGDRVRLTLGAGDVLSPRGVRLAALAPHLDELGLLLEPQRLRLGGPPSAPDLDAAAFTVQLAIRLATAADRAAPPVHVVTGIAAGEASDLEAAARAGELEGAAARAAVRVSLGIDREGDRRIQARGRAPEGRAIPEWEVPLLDPPRAARATEELLTRLRDSGVAGVTATAWTTLADRVAMAAPLDRRPSLARHGLALPGGELRAAGEPWAALATAEREVTDPQPWPGELDPEQYYAALPDAARDLFTGWRAERGDGGRTDPEDGPT